MDFVIESDIPMIPLRIARNNGYPFATMAIGDSFAIPAEQDASKIRSAACYFGIRHPPMKFAVRISDPATRAYRCWRIA